MRLLLFLVLALLGPTYAESPEYRECRRIMFKIQDYNLAQKHKNTIKIGGDFLAHNKDVPITCFIEINQLLGASYVSIKDYDNALKRYQAILDIDKNLRKRDYTTFMFTVFNISNVYAKTGNYNAAFNGYLLGNEDNYHSFALDFLLSFTKDHGTPNHKYIIGNMYLGKNGTLFKIPALLKYNTFEAMNWYLDAAKDGHADAEYAIAQMYLEGLGVKYNIQKAFEWYSKALAHGNLDAGYEMAMLYYEGVDTNKNIGKAKAIFGDLCDKKIQKACDMYKQASSSKN